MKNAIGESKSGTSVLAPPDATPASNVKIWTVGTLTYTAGGLTLLFFWLLLGDFALSLRDRSVGPVVQLFLKREGVSNTAMALLLSTLPPLLGLIISPIVSYRSDRLRTRWGRRIPFLIIPTPIAAAAMIGIALTPWIAGAVHTAASGMFSKTACTIAVFGVFWTIFEVAAITSGAVFGGLINDVVPRPVLGRFFGLFRAVSLIDGMIFNYFLIAHAETHFLEMFGAIAIIFGGGFVLMCIKVKEGQYASPQLIPASQPQSAAAGKGPAVIPYAPTQRKGFFAALKIYCTECYSKPYYLWYFATFTIAGVTFMPINLFSIPYAKELNIDMGFYGKMIAISYAVSLALAYPLGSLADRFHPLRVGIAAMILYALSTAWGAFNIHDQATFGIALVLHTIISGTYFTTTASVGQRLLPRSKFSQFASAGGIIASITTMTLSPAMGQILDRTDNNYRLTFVAGLLLACLSVVLLVIIHHKFMALGGPKGYVAPGDDVVE